MTNSSKALSFSLFAAAAQDEMGESEVFRCSNTFMNDQEVLERNVLKDLYESTDGDGWVQKQGWLKDGIHHCDWYGVSCSSQCHVDQLILDGNELSGPIPSNLEKLGFLEQLHLESNQLFGPIPTTLSHLGSLKRLYLSNNDLTGPIPSALSRLKSLTELELYYNSLTGTLPKSLGDLSNMVVLSLTGNELSGSIPSNLAKLENLEWLSLSKNELNGTIPTFIGNLVELRTLGLRENELSGSIPSTLSKLVNLTELFLYDNSLTGTLPESIGDLEKLKWILFNGNELSGSIPSTLSKLANLEDLYLYDNSLSGTIPEAIGNMTEMTWLALGENELSGSIPSTLSKLVNLRELSLDDNKLTGTIPAFVGKLTLIEWLGLNGNELSGTIPFNLSKLLYLDHLNLSKNRLNGTIPAPLGDLADLTRLDLHGNELSGSIPSTLSTLGSLNWLDLNNNNLAGIIPSFDNLTELKELDLSNNNLTGAVPSQLGKLLNLEVLNLGSNHLAGRIPSEIGNLGELKYLYLENNFFSNMIPEVLGLLFRIRKMNLSQRRYGDVCFAISSQCEWDNNDRICEGRRCSESQVNESEDIICCHNHGGLLGTIPPAFGDFLYLEVLNLSSNLLGGSIPQELGDLARLKVLDLSDNRLEERIPSQLGSLSTVNMTIRLNKNEGLLEHKPAPLSLCTIAGFDLADNITLCPPERNFLKSFYEDSNGQSWLNSSGWVGQFNEHCEWHGVECNHDRKVVKLKLGKNGLAGSISQNVANLKFLQEIDLHDNELRGNIPVGMEALSSLKSLRVSYNILTGNIPSGLGDLTNLSLLHLHSNRLSGTAPHFISYRSPDFSPHLIGFQSPNFSALVADCGSPSDFEPPLECEDCTMCCNSLGMCHVRDNKQKFGIGYLTVVFFISLLAFLCIFTLICRTLVRTNIVRGIECRAMVAIGDGSVYFFFLTRCLMGWVVGLAVLTLQGGVFAIFIIASQLDFSDDTTVWVYSWKCPRNNPECKDTDDRTWVGWMGFFVVVAAKVSRDLWNAMKVLFMSATMKELSWKSFHCFFGGFALASITSLAIWTSTIYNSATARSDTELIVNAAIILFVNDIDEDLFVFLKAARGKWVKKLEDEAEAFPNKATAAASVSVQAKSIDHTADPQRENDEQALRNDQEYQKIEMIMKDQAKKIEELTQIVLELKENFSGNSLVTTVGV